MRRFSQRQGLQTLSEINVTPMLDLCFVLLVIFMITTPLLESNNDLALPSGNSTSRQRRPGQGSHDHRGPQRGRCRSMVNRSRPPGSVNGWKHSAASGRTWRSSSVRTRNSPSKSSSA